jgi:uncharacterized protein (DUF2141 family)
MSLTGEVESTELWVNAKNKAGVVFKTIWNCTDISRFQKENPELAKRLSDGLTAWLKADQNNINVLKDWSKEGGYKLDEGEWTYKVVQNNDGSRKLSRIPKSAGGFSKSSRPFTVFRTVEVKVGRIEDVKTVVANQLDADNWEVVYMATDAEGDKFLLLNKRPYTPPTATTATVVDPLKGDTGAKEENTEEESQ